MSNVLEDNADGVIEAEVATLPEPQCAPSEGLRAAEAIQQPALSEEELRERQIAMGTRRRPAGPPLEGGQRGALSAIQEHPSDVPETDSDAKPKAKPNNAHEPLASSARDRQEIGMPTNLTLFRNIALPASATSGQTSTVGEPSLANNGAEIYYSGNWYAARSLDNAASWAYVNPFTTFPSADGGFCCDQTLIYDPTRNITIWLLQYIRQNNTNTLRVVVKKGTRWGRIRLLLRPEAGERESGLGGGVVRLQQRRAVEQLPLHHHELIQREHLAARGRVPDLARHSGRRGRAVVQLLFDHGKRLAALHSGRGRHDVFRQPQQFVAGARLHLARIVDHRHLQQRQRDVVDGRGRTARPARTAGTG